MAATLAGLAAPASAEAALVTGELTDARGTPAGGTLVAYVWPAGSRDGKLAVAARARVAGHGRFTLQADEPDRLARAAGSGGGWVDLLLEGDTQTGFGEHFISVKLSPDGQATAASAGEAAHVSLQADRPDPPGATAAKGCAGVPPRTRKLSSHPAWGYVGEINNAYRDTTAKFVYGQVADSDISVAIAPEGQGFKLEGTRHVSNSSSDEIKRSRRGPYARKILSKFIFGKYRVIRCGPAANSTVLRADDWAGGIRDQRSKGTINNCTGGEPYYGDDEYTRLSSEAVTWTGGFRVLGIGLDVRSGFSNHVRIGYKFGGSEKRVHVLCGEEGKPHTLSGRIFSGAARAS